MQRGTDTGTVFTCYDFMRFGDSVKVHDSKYVAFFTAYLVSILKD